jgi:hypothetical protein
MQCTSTPSSLPASPDRILLGTEPLLALRNWPHQGPIVYLDGKVEHPTEALLGAHYLLRFLPNRLPLAWADNLSIAYPKAADGPVIAAWLRLTSNAEVRRSQTKQVASEVRRLLS